MSRFKGDERRVLDALPKYTQEGTVPMRVQRGVAWRQIQQFEKDGFSSHSVRGDTLWVIIEHCETSGISYTVEGGNGLVYRVQRIQKPTG